MASQSMAAHIMKPVVSISMSPDSCSSGERGEAAAALAGEPGLLVCDSSFKFSPCARSNYGMDGLTPSAKTARISYPRSKATLHVDVRPRRLHLVRRQARALARSQHPRPHALAALRPGRFRGRARV